MLGAIIGDIVGSTREWHNIKTENFELVPKGSRFTDDTVMTLAVAEWLMTDPEHQPETLVACMQRLGRKYPNAGYGKMFWKWLMSDHPQPYNSFGNGSAMRVSPVGLYANSLEEALELARITASVSHNHSEGIKGAQAIAGCVFLKKNDSWGSEEEIKRFITEKIGYNLDFNLDDIRDTYSFDVTCQGSVPIAIKAYLDRSGYPAEKALRLAISMGGDSDTIGAMTASIAGAQPFYIIGGGFSDDLVNQCRALLPADLLDINDRFEAFVSRPLHQSYYIGRYLFAGEYPGDKYGELAEAKLKRMYHFGVRHFVDLTEEGELRPYRQLLPNDTTYLRFPIRDVDVPKSVEAVHQLIDKMEYLLQQDGYTYIHCWGGVGRTGTIVACYEARQMEEPTLEKALTAMRNNFAEMPKTSHRKSPETQEQIDFVRQFVESCKQRGEYLKLRTKDRIRGSLMAGAAGDALGYTVEFMSRKSILAQYGTKGITKFDLSSEGKALVSDDTQMTLFTACGMLMGVTRGYMRGIGGQPEKYVDGAYLDWYYTQTGKKKEMLTDDFHYTWLRDLPELAHRRAPGNTCLSACESLYQSEEVQNNSKGCGGIMRVAPMALLMAGYWGRGGTFYNVQQMDEAGGEVAAVTHKHPLAFLPSAMLTHLIYRVIRMEEAKIKTSIADIALETIDSICNIYKGEYEEDKRYLANLTRMAVKLAANDKSDAENIRLLGEGWTGEEAWAIALYCVVRHIGNIEDAIIAAVNHDGDSDSTGAVCGNIMGAIYGYEAMKRKRLFCPQGKELEQTLELSNIILALADDLYTSCIISEYGPIDTPEERQWYERYCEMKPVGLKSEMMYNKRYTPERILNLKENEIFVFGCRRSGRHKEGAAAYALEHFGAIYGQSNGRQGRAYAIATAGVDLTEISESVNKFLEYAKMHSKLHFLVTPIGCGLGGWDVEEIAPLFREAISIENIILPKDFVTYITAEGKRSYNLERFLTAHKYNYENALREITDGCKRTHWIWFIFPQLAVLGRSANAKYYGISGYDEAKAYLEHPILGARLREITMALLQHRGESVVDILGDIDAIKVRSCMTLFDAVSSDDIFQDVLDAFYDGTSDKKTLDYL